MYSKWNWMQDETVFTYFTLLTQHSSSRNEDVLKSLTHNNHSPHRSWPDTFWTHHTILLNVYFYTKFAFSYFPSNISLQHFPHRIQILKYDTASVGQNKAHNGRYNSQDNGDITTQVSQLPQKPDHSLF